MSGRSLLPQREYQRCRPSGPFGKPGDCAGIENEHARLPRLANGSSRQSPSQGTGARALGGAGNPDLGNEISKVPVSLRK